MTSLWYQTQERLQPDIQNMDQETLDKIKENKPKYQASNTNYVLTSTELSLIRNLSPQPDWYVNPKIVKSIHGIAHAVRVMVYVTILTRNIIDNKDREALLIACSVHDTQRINDRSDEGHEERAVTWLSEHFDHHPLLNQILMILRDASSLSKYLRAADALDRFRLPKVNWWIKDSYLEVIPTEQLKGFSFNLVLASEQHRLNGIDDLEAIFCCLRK